MNRTQKNCSKAAVITIALLLVLCGCQGLRQNPTGNGDITAVNHIIFMAQENRSLDTYFGQLPQYWAANGYPAQQFDGMPSNASNPAYNGTTTPGNTTVNAFHFATECIENLSPSWNESHEDWNLQSPTDASSPLLNGYVYNAAVYATNNGFTDTQGVRSMGYYDWTDLPYYYFMASNFATSDRWFSPAMDRTQINRMYLMAATSGGYAYPPGTNTADQGPVNVPTIFDSLTNANVSWKIYATDNTCSAAPPPSDTGAGGSAQAHSANANQTSGGFCTYLTQFAKYASGPLPSNVVSGAQFLQDANAGTLPAVSFIEPGYLSGQDEHPSSGTSVQVGAAYVASLINGLMASPSWKDSVFILTYDEAGGTYDHEPPQPAVSPDGISPVDLATTDICYNDASNPLCNFQYTGYRLPMLVVSPFTKKNYVSHTVTDYTAILKFIETRFNLQPLTQRDAAQMDMTEFFDFQNAPWATPPSNIPTQPTGGTCNASSLGYPGP